MSQPIPLPTGILKKGPKGTGEAPKKVSFGGTHSGPNTVDQDWVRETPFQTQEELAQARREARIASTHFCPSRIVLYTLGVMLCLQETAGMSLPLGLSAYQAAPGYPEQGDCLKDGSHNFAEVDALLKMAVPTSWEGAAAEAYTTANATLMRLAQQMVDQDREMETRVKHHAEYVAKTQLDLGITQDVVIAAYPLVCYLEASLTTYEAARWLAYAVAVAAITAGLILLYDCLRNAEHTVQDVHKVSYADVISTVDKVGQADQPAPYASGVTAPAASVSADLAHRTYAPSTSSDMPTVASSPSRASGSRRSAHRAGGAIPPDQTAPPTPASTAPAVAAVAPPSRHAANVAGSATPPNGRANQQSQQDQHADSEETGHPGDVEDAGADAGPSWGERAPIEITASAPALQQINATASS